MDDSEQMKQSENQKEQTEAKGLENESVPNSDEDSSANANERASRMNAAKETNHPWRQMPT